MIGQLMREQLRAHRTYLVWTTALLTLAVGLASYAAFVALQSQAGVSAYVRAAYGMDGDWRGSAVFWDGWDGGPVALTWDQVDQALDAAEGDGSHAVALMPVDVRAHVMTPEELSAAGGVPWEWMAGSVAALRGDVDWDALLLDGGAPGDGEIAVDAEWAAANGLEVGDSVHTSTYAGVDETDYALAAGDLTISGLLRTSLPGRYATGLYDAFVGWDSVPGLVDHANDEAAATPVGSVQILWQVDVSSDAKTPALSVFSTSTSSGDYYGSAIDSASVVLAIAAGVLVIGLIGMAFAAGRAQAQLRTRWVATARVLGARRSAIAWATMLEVALVGTAAGALGVGTAYVLFASDWSRVVADNPDALVSTTPNVPWWAAPVLIAAALLIAGILGAVPAFWAARVAPAAALKPVTPVSEAQTSRNVPLWPLLAIWTPLALCTVVSVKAIVGNGAWLGEISYSSTFRMVAVLVGIAAAVASTMLVVEISRRATTFAVARLARGRRPWQIAASGALAGRPRQASGPASVLAVASAVSIGSMTWLALSDWVDLGPGLLDPSPFALAHGWGWGDGTTRFEQWVVIVTFGVLTLAALAAFLTQRAAARDEGEAQAALGLSGADARLASGIQFALPLATSAVVGAALGLVSALALFTRMDWSAAYADDGIDASASLARGSVWAAQNIGHAVPLLLLTLAISLAWIAVGAAIAAGTVRVTPRTRERISA